MWYQFDSNSVDYQFVNDFGYLANLFTYFSTELEPSLQLSEPLNFCHFHVGIDGISLYFVLLTTFITPLCILSN